MSSTWTCDRPGYWRLGGTGWSVTYETGPPEHGDLGWWLRHDGKLAPPAGQPFMSLARAQEFAATHWANGQPITDSVPAAYPQRACGRSTPHAEHDWMLPDEEWRRCPGCEAPERRCREQPSHKAHLWYPGNGVVAYLCNGARLPAGQCAMTSAHAPHQHWEPPSLSWWCAGIPEGKRCHRHDIHHCHDWFPSRSFAGNCYRCPGYGRTTITSDMSVTEVTDRLGQSLGRERLDLVVREIQARHH